LEFLINNSWQDFLNLAKPMVAPPKRLRQCGLRVAVTSERVGSDHALAFKSLWNKDDDNLFLPKRFGVGWSLNFHALGKKLGLIRKR
jgi:hypothetical protein